MRSNEIQYLHKVKFRQMVVEDYRQVLEEHFGGRKKVPAKIEAVIIKGEKEIDGRIKVLRMADRVSWLAVDKYQADPLCEGEEDDKKWKQAVKEALEEKEKRKGYPFRKDRGGNGYSSNNRRDSYGWYSYRRPYSGNNHSYGRLGGNDGRSD